MSKYRKYVFSLVVAIVLTLQLSNIAQAVEPENYKLLKVIEIKTYTQPQTFVVRMFKLDPLDRSEGACTKQSEDHGCGKEGYPYPNETNEWEVNIENFYMPNTLPEEVNTAPLPALESVAVAIRSYALHLDYYGTESWHLDNTVKRQVFVPYSDKATTQTDQAVANTREVFLACGSNCPQSRQGFPALAEHGAAHPDYFTTATTDLTNHPYLDSVYDSIYSQDNRGHGRGLA